MSNLLVLAAAGAGALYLLLKKKASPVVAPDWRTQMEATGGTMTPDQISSVRAQIDALIAIPEEMRVDAQKVLLTQLLALGVYEWGVEAPDDPAGDPARPAWHQYSTQNLDL